MQENNPLDAPFTVRSRSLPEEGGGRNHPLESESTEKGKAVDLNRRVDSQTANSGI